MLTFMNKFIGNIICDRILENSSKSHMKSGVFLHVFNDISTYAYVFTGYSLHTFSNLNIKFHVSAMNHLAVINKNV